MKPHWRIRPSWPVRLWLPVGRSAPDPCSTGRRHPLPQFRDHDGPGWLGKEEEEASSLREEVCDVIGGCDVIIDVGENGHAGLEWLGLDFAVQHLQHCRLILWVIPVNKKKLLFYT